MKDACSPSRMTPLESSLLHSSEMKKRAKVRGSGVVGAAAGKASLRLDISNNSRPRMNIAPAPLLKRYRRVELPPQSAV